MMVHPAVSLAVRLRVCTNLAGVGSWNSLLAITRVAKDLDSLPAHDEVPAFNPTVKFYKRVGGYQADGGKVL